MHLIFLILTILNTFYLHNQLAVAMTNPTSSSSSVTTSSGAPITTTSSAYPQILPSKNPIVERSNDGDNGVLISVTGRMNYVTPDTKQIDIHRHKDGTDSGMQGATWHPVDIPIANGRLIQKKLHQHGYQLVDLTTTVQEENTVPVSDFLDTDQVIDNFYPTCEQLLHKILGPDVQVAKAFDHNIRISREERQEELKGGGGSKAQVPIGMVHGDYTKVSGPKRLHDLAQRPKANDVMKDRLLQAGQESLLDPTMVQEALEGKRRFALINVWRNIDPENPVQELPLACADAQNVVMDDLRTLSIHYPDRVGENYFVAHNPSHKWAYFPEMTHDEAMLIKQWDSLGVIDTGSDENISCFAIHSAFADPSSLPTARPRRSIEVRVAVIWKENN
ncbi:unnamed protein product [Cylindrotheca closterium]|uniref:Methyltransferase n=1 Tax=Cylindrotheca closterium TaxID=2856 RepID=A0AAD2FB13_9STRA|nr:unnamed protein product [Cylindrotheca closterium]